MAFACFERFGEVCELGLDRLGQLRSVWAQKIQETFQTNTKIKQPSMKNRMFLGTPISEVFQKDSMCAAQTAAPEVKKEERW